MTLESLKAAIDAGDLAQVADQLAGATEAERRAVARAVTLRLKELEKDDHTGWSAQLDAAGLAQLGTATLAELRKAGWRAQLLPGGPELCANLLKARQPDWLCDWADWILEQNPYAWKTVRQLVREGVIPRPEGEAYVRGMLAVAYRPGADVLLAEDPDLLEGEVWRIFEVEGGGEDSLAARDKFTADEHTWSTVLCRLSAEGRLSRDRLLDASLEALQRDFDQFRAGWFSRFHETLTPTHAERATRVNTYLALLSSRIPPTVSFALKALSEIDRHGALPGPDLVTAIAPTLSARAKGTALSALKLLGRAAQRDPSLAPAASRVICEALLHESPEVQSAALDLIEKLGTLDDPDLQSLLRSRLEDVVPSLRPRIAGWITTAPTEPAASAHTEEREADPALLARAAAIPEPLAHRAGIPAALAALERGAELAPALDLRPLDFPRLDPQAALQPVQDTDELLDLLTSLLETGEPADDLERAVDGLSRLCDQQDHHFAQRAAPLLLRAKNLTKRREGPGWWGNPREDLALLVLAWLGGEVAAAGKTERIPDLCAYLGKRNHELARRVADRVALPLLSFPTHRGGWIAPLSLVDRLHAWEAQGRVPENRDLCAALLRLAPEGREAALVKARDMAGEAGGAVRHALGAEETTVGATAILWAAAARARNPWGDDPAVNAAHPHLGPDGGLAARVEITFHRRVYGTNGEWVSYEPNLRWTPTLPHKSALRDDQLTLLHCTRWSVDYVEGGGGKDEIPGRRWAATLWPTKRLGWFARGCERIGDNIDWYEATWAHRVQLEPLLDPDTHLGDEGELLIAIALGAKDPTEAGLAIDALIATVEDGRLDAGGLARALELLLQGGPARPARWSKTLGEAARVSPLHQAVVRDVLERMLAVEAEIQPAALGALLSLLHELCVETATPVTRGETREQLEGVRTGKSGKLAKALLALPTGSPPCPPGTPSSLKQPWAEASPPCTRPSLPAASPRGAGTTKPGNPVSALPASTHSLGQGARSVSQDPVSTPSASPPPLLQGADAASHDPEPHRFQAAHHALEARVSRAERWMAWSAAS